MKNVVVQRVKTGKFWARAGRSPWEKNLQAAEIFSLDEARNGFEASLDEGEVRLIQVKIEVVRR